MEIQHPSLQEILLTLESTSPMYGKKAINVYRISQNISDEQDPFYQEAVSRFCSSLRDYLKALRLIELGVLDISSTNLDQSKGPDCIYFNCISTVFMELYLFIFIGLDLFFFYSIHVL